MLPLFVNSFVLRLLQHSIWCCVTGWCSEVMHCVHLEGEPPDLMRMMVTHYLGTVGSGYPMTQLRVLYTGVLSILLDCCVMHRPAGKCLGRFVGKLSSVWDTHRNIVYVIVNMTRLNYVLWDWRFSQQCCWTLEFSGMWRVLVPLSSGSHILTFWDCLTVNVWHSVMSQKTPVLSWCENRPDT